MVTTPFIAALSIAKGRLTFGDTGKLNYAWLVTGGVTGYRFWEGKEPGSGTPKHPPRKIFDNPEVFEVGTPVGGTYPPWYDPSYWYEGLTVKFNLKRQIKILVNNTSFYYKHFFGSLFFGYLILVCVGGRFWLSVKDLIANWQLLIPAAAGLGVYAIGADMQLAFTDTQPSTRYIAPFIVLLFAGVFSSVRLPDSQELRRLIGGMTIIAFVVGGGKLAYQSAVAKEFESGLRIPEHHIHQHIQWQVAQSLNKLGVEPGEKVAILGEYFFPNYYWARLARIKIVAEIRDEQSFWEKNADVRFEVLKTLERTGAKVIVQRPGLKIPDSAYASGWKQVGDTGYYVYFFGK